MEKKDREYFRIHGWLSFHHGKAKKCENENCASVNPKRFEWALLKGKDYERNRNNYIQLCPSCHRKYDFTETQREKLIAAGKKKTFSETTRKKISQSCKGKGVIAVIQKDKTGKELILYKSVSEAAKKTKILQSSISNNLTKRSKTAGGFIWEHKHTN
jgi:hypothetical protein